MRKNKQSLAFICLLDLLFVMVFVALLLEEPEKLKYLEVLNEAQTNQIDNLQSQVDQLQEKLAQTQTQITNIEAENKNLKTTLDNRLLDALVDFEYIDH